MKLSLLKVITTSRLGRGLEGSIENYAWVSVTDRGRCAGVGPWDFFLWLQCRIRYRSSLQTVGVTEMKQRLVFVLYCLARNLTPHCLLPAVQGGACIRSAATLICWLLFLRCQFFIQQQFKVSKSLRWWNLIPANTDNRASAHEIRQHLEVWNWKITISWN